PNGSATGPWSCTGGGSSPRGGSTLCGPSSAWRATPPWRISSSRRRAGGWKAGEAPDLSDELARPGLPRRTAGLEPAPAPAPPALLAPRLRWVPRGPGPAVPAGGGGRGDGEGGPRRGCRRPRPLAGAGRALGAALRGNPPLGRDGPVAHSRHPRRPGAPFPQPRLQPGPGPLPRGPHGASPAGRPGPLLAPVAPPLPPGRGGGARAGAPRLLPSHALGRALGGRAPHGRLAGPGTGAPGRADPPVPPARSVRRGPSHPPRTGLASRCPVGSGPGRGPSSPAPLGPGPASGPGTSARLGRRPHGDRGGNGRVAWGGPRRRPGPGGGALAGRLAPGRGVL